MYLDICMHEIFVLANVHQFCEEIEQSSRSGTVDDLKKVKRISWFDSNSISMWYKNTKLYKSYVSLRAFLTILLNKL